MKSQRTISERNATGWMHVYGQISGHDPVEIRGTTEALVALRNALTAAIEGDGVSEAIATASDGEGYAVQVRRVNVLNLLGPLPYEGHTGREGWADWRHESWKAPPEPFNPEIHRVMVFVDRDGSNPSLAPPGGKWLPISTYPRDPEPAGPRDDASDDWGPEVLLLMPPCGEYPHGPVAVTGHLEAGMWLSRDAAEPACWGDLAAEPIAWCPLPDASGIAAAEPAKRDSGSTVRQEPAPKGTPNTPP